MRNQLQQNHRRHSKSCGRDLRNQGSQISGKPIALILQIFHCNLAFELTLVKSIFDVEAFLFEYFGMLTYGSTRPVSKRTINAHAQSRLGRTGGFKNRKLV